jgi:hypothetical protein
VNLVESASKGINLELWRHGRRALLSGPNGVCRKVEKKVYHEVRAVGGACESFPNEIVAGCDAAVCFEGASSNISNIARVFLKGFNILDRTTGKLLESTDILLLY